jgi:tRNA pseudouridine38-40 synthase
MSAKIVNTYKLIIAYDGTNYSGWQAQAHRPSIAVALNHAFKKVFKYDIKVLGASRTDAGVHALDHFFTERPLPFIQRYGYFYPYKIDIELLKKALETFIGTHDFASFRNVEDVRENTIRTIDSITLEYVSRYKAYCITVKGQKFLRHMIRRIVGASLHVATKDNSALLKLQNILAACNPAHTLPNAPAQGLMLRKIIYTH